MGIVELVILLARGGGNGKCEIRGGATSKMEDGLDDDFSKECR